MFLKYIAVEIRQILFRKESQKLYKFWSFKDRKLLETFKIQ